MKKVTEIVVDQVRHDVIMVTDPTQPIPEPITWRMSNGIPSWYIELGLIKSGLEAISEDLPKNLRGQKKEFFNTVGLDYYDVDHFVEKLKSMYSRISRAFEELELNLIKKPSMTEVSKTYEKAEPSPELLDAYNMLSSEGKKEMRAKHPVIKWPEVKEYVTDAEAMDNNEWIDLPPMDDCAPFVMEFKNCRPEIDEEKGGIRFVKLG